jgi:UDP-N-acetylglucosamine--N-acetylmuramyl-(pentapeptide) pyrophosphoryl-undecaprenol N-acetylglucosamine transferase
MRIVFAGGGTGGHLYPGLAIARAVQRLRPDIQPFFVGARRGVERDVLPTTHFPHVLLDLHPLYRATFWNNWRTLVGMTTAWRGIRRVVSDERPALVVGTGGYAAGAMLAYAIVHGIPIAQQASDALPSLTTRLFSRWSREIYLAIPEAARHLRVRSPDALIDTGAPIEPPPQPRPERNVARRAWTLADATRVVLVYGGSQGSLAINRAVADWVKAGLPAGVGLIWATGKATFQEFASLASPSVKIQPYLSPIADAYAASDLAVTRAGMMTIAELCAWHIPSVLIPLPTAAADHQTKNAKTLATAGAAVQLSQSDLSGERLGRTIGDLLNDSPRLTALARSAASRARPHAAEEIARRIIALADACTSMADRR